MKKINELKNAKDLMCVKEILSQLSQEKLKHS